MGINIVEFVVSAADSRVNLFKNYLLDKQIDAKITGENHLALLHEDQTETIIVLATENNQDVTFVADFQGDIVIGASKKVIDTKTNHHAITDLETGEVFIEPIPSENEPIENEDIAPLSSCPPGYVLREYNCRDVAKINWVVFTACLAFWRRPVCLNRAGYTVRECSVDCFRSGTIV